MSPPSTTSLVFVEWVLGCRSIIGPVITPKVSDTLQKVINDKDQNTISEPKPDNVSYVLRLRPLRGWIVQTR